MMFIPSPRAMLYTCIPSFLPSRNSWCHCKHKYDFVNPQLLSNSFIEALSSAIESNPFSSISLTLPDSSLLVSIDRDSGY
jgi:hypothetical protein